MGETFNNGLGAGRVSAVVYDGALLASDGSYAASELYELPLRCKALTVAFPYTRGTDGGYPLLKLQWGIGGTLYWDTTPTGGATVSGATVETPVRITVIPGVPPANGSALNTLFTLDVPDGVDSVKVHVAEADATKATPGTVGPITLAAGR